MPLKLAQILLQKKQKDPAGLREAQKNGTMAVYLREDLLANGINPDSLEFGGNPDLNVGGAMSITKNLKSGLKDESKPLEAVNQTITHAQEVIAPKYKEWHKDCFICGLGNGTGCKKQLIKGEYDTNCNIAYCKACYIHNFQSGAARGAILKTNEKTSYNNKTPALAEEVEAKHISVSDQIKSFNNKSGNK